MLVVSAVLCCLVSSSGCRSAGKSKNDSLADTETTVAPDPTLVADANNDLPAYAKDSEAKQGDATTQPASTNGIEPTVQLASAKTKSIIPLRTLSAADDLQQIVSTAPGAVMIDFYAPWCGPCRTQGKVLSELESFAAANQAQIIKVDIDQHKAIAKSFSIKSLPTLIVIKNGKIIQRKVGLTNESKLRAMLK